MMYLAKPGRPPSWQFLQVSSEMSELNEEAKKANVLILNEALIF